MTFYLFLSRMEHCKSSTPQWFKFSTPRADTTSNNAQSRFWYFTRRPSYVAPSR